MGVAVDEKFRAVARELEDIARKRLNQQYREKQERRAAHRIPFHHMVPLAEWDEARPSSEWTWRPIMSWDVSRDGLGLVSPSKKLQVDTLVVVHCLTARRMPMVIPGRVVRVHEVIPGLYATGIQFQFRSE